MLKEAEVKILILKPGEFQVAIHIGAVRVSVPENMCLELFQTKALLVCKSRCESVKGELGGWLVEICQNRVCGECPFSLLLIPCCFRPCPLVMEMCIFCNCCVI